MNIEWTNADALSCEQTTKTRYIDANAIEQDFQEWRNLFSWEDGATERAILSRAIQTLQSQLTADVVEVVRCKDCKHYKQSKVDPSRKMCCRKDVDGVHVCYDFYPTNYCSYGERRDEPTMEEYMYGQEGSEEDGSL